MSIATARPTWTTADELLEQLGGVAVKRLRLRPAPGTATERDLLQIHDRERRIYELADSVLVEKIIGFPGQFSLIPTAHGAFLLSTAVGGGGER